MLLPFIEVQTSSTKRKKSARMKQKKKKQSILAHISLENYYYYKWDAVNNSVNGSIICCAILLWAHTPMHSLCARQSMLALSMTCCRMRDRTVHGWRTRWTMDTYGGTNSVIDCLFFLSVHVCVCVCLKSAVGALSAPFLCFYKIECELTGFSFITNDFNICITIIAIDGPLNSCWLLRSMSTSMSSSLFLSVDILRLQRFVCFAFFFCYCSLCTLVCSQHAIYARMRVCVCGGAGCMYCMWRCLETTRHRSIRYTVWNDGQWENRRMREWEKWSKWRQERINCSFVVVAVHRTLNNVLPHKKK